MKQYTKAKALLESLKTIPDYRVDIGKIEYPLAEVLFMMIFALLKGNTKFKEIFGWMIYNKDNPVLKEIFKKEEVKMPSKSTLHNILTNTDNNTLERVFREYFSNYVKKENIAIDGKWLNGSDVNGQYTNECHKAILNILDKDTKIVFAHKFMAKNKENEITALKQAFDEDDLFSDEGQIFSFDAIQTQTQILNSINSNGDKYLAKVKDNQKRLKQKIIETIETYEKPIDSYFFEDDGLSCGKKYVTREVELFYSPSIDIAMYDEKFDNIQTLIRINKTLTDPKTKEQTFYSEYLIANFRTTAEDFYNKIISHWRVETYHYHLDMLMKEDEHIAYKEPFSIAILRSFALNLFQLFLNANKDKKLPTGKTTMAEIKRTCKYDDYFTIQLFEQE
jgi:predicted transposase YbfD/YdcC